MNLIKLLFCSDSTVEFDGRNREHDIKVSSGRTNTYNRITKDKARQGEQSRTKENNGEQGRTRYNKVEQGRTR